MSLFVGGAVLFGEVELSFFVAGAAFGEVQVFLFVAGAAVQHLVVIFRVRCSIW